MDDLCCCLADFGLSLFVETQALDSSSTISKGSIHWLATEYMDSTLFDQTYVTARDIYAYGCTIVEVGQQRFVTTLLWHCSTRSLLANHLLVIPRMTLVLYTRS